MFRLSICTRRVFSLSSPLRTSSDVSHVLPCFLPFHSSQDTGGNSQRSVTAPTAKLPTDSYILPVSFDNIAPPPARLPDRIVYAKQNKIYISHGHEKSPTHGPMGLPGRNKSNEWPPRCHLRKYLASLQRIFFVFTTYFLVFSTYFLVFSKSIKVGLAPHPSSLLLASHLSKRQWLPQSAPSSILNVEFLVHGDSARGDTNQRRPIAEFCLKQ